MNTITICCKLQTNEIQEELLLENSTLFAKACNIALAYRSPKQTRFSLHKACYQCIRKETGIKANYACQAIARVVASKRAKAFSARSFVCDVRTFSVLGNSVRISVHTGKPIQVPMLLGEYQRKHLQGDKPSSATVHRQNGSWYINICIKKEVVKKEAGIDFGVDVGIANVAYTSSGTAFCGKALWAKKAQFRRVRASLQSKRTRGAKKVLRRLSGKERRYIRAEIHKISKAIVAEAERHTAKNIRLELLKGISQRVSIPNKHTSRMGRAWSFYELQSFVKYKAEAIGMSVEFVDPAYTSQSCHQCLLENRLTLGSRSGIRFCCPIHGKKHADHNAAQNISLGLQLKKLYPSELAKAGKEGGANCNCARKVARKSRFKAHAL